MIQTYTLFSLERVSLFFIHVWTDNYIVYCELFRACVILPRSLNTSCTYVTLELRTFLRVTFVSRETTILAEFNGVLWKYFPVPFLVYDWLAALRLLAEGDPRPPRRSEHICEPTT